MPSTRQNGPLTSRSTSVLLTRLDATTPTWYLVASLVVVGLGQAMFQSPNSRAIMGAAPATEQGVASGMLATARVLGQSLSVALAGAVFTGLGGAAAGALLLAGRGTLSPERAGALAQTFVDALHAALFVCAAVAAIGVVTALARGQEAAGRGQGCAASERCRAAPNALLRASRPALHRARSRPSGPTAGRTGPRCGRGVPGPCGCQKFGSRHATCAYSWINPPSRSRRTILPADAKPTGSPGPTGDACPHARCGRWPLSWSAYSTRTARSCRQPKISIRSSTSRRTVPTHRSA